VYVVVEMEACYPSYVVYRHNKRVNLQEDDMTTVKIARIFQVSFWFTVTRDARATFAAVAPLPGICCTCDIPRCNTECKPFAGYSKANL